MDMFPDSSRMAATCPQETLTSGSFQAAYVNTNRQRRYRSRAVFAHVMQDLALPAATRRAEAARDSIRAWNQALRQPPDVAGGVRNATLSIVVGHVGDRPERPSAGCDRTSHGCVGVLDVEIVRSTRWLEASPRLADHDRGIAKPYMGVAHDALGRGEYVQDLAAKALNEESQIGTRIRCEDVRKHRCEARWDVHVYSLKSMPSVRLRGFYLSPWVSALGRVLPVGDPTSGVGPEAVRRFAR
jgi:hypothetical protein